MATWNVVPLTSGGVGDYINGFACFIRGSLSVSHPRPLMGYLHLFMYFVAQMHSYDFRKPPPPPPLFYIYPHRLLCIFLHLVMHSR